MTGFTSLADALHAGYDVIASTQSGYIVRLVRGDGAESYGLVTLAANPEPARDAPRASAVSGCSAKFALELDRGVPVVRVGSGVDAYNISAFKAIIECAEATGDPAIIVALGVTQYVCARAFGILSVLHTRLGKVNRWLGIACDPRSYARRIMALLEVPFPVFDNVENAIAAERRERSAQ
jgi:hypothetical protein